jgi:hypothetical protein
MEIEFSLTEEDYVALCQHAMKRILDPRAIRAGKMRVLLFATVSLLVIFFLNFSQAEPGEELKNLPLFVVFSAVVLGGCWALVTCGMRPRPIKLEEVRRQMREGRNALMLENRRVVLSAEMLTVNTKSLGSVTRPWTSIASVSATPNYLFIYLSESEAQIVPRRAFHSEAEFRAFVEAAQGYHARAGLERFADARPPSGPDRVSENPPAKPGGESGVTRQSGNADSVQ